MCKCEAKKRSTLIGCLALLAASFACAQKPGDANINTNSANQSVNQPANQSASQPVAPQLTLTPSGPAYASGGLGLDRAEWERSHGNGTPDNPGSPMMFGYEGGKFQVQFSSVRSGNVEYIERVWGDRNAVPIEEAREESKQFIPADAKFVKTYTSRSGSTVDQYRSESLKGRFSDDDWTGGKPGDFIILYRNQTGRTTTFIIGTGNNP
ncbi:MAG: hypothetical protein LC785_06020 [Acidobacteria bacterium]|nr:hypothetical protein [Acidobacteriota bacterium]MCA1641502.1 hypothetical protein [Acidobacteriota bacterium]